VWIIGTKRGSVRARSVRSKCVRTQGAIRRGTPRPCWPQGAMGSTTTWCWEVLVRAQGRACVACVVSGGQKGKWALTSASLFPLPLSSQLTAAGGSPRSLHTIISSGVTVSRGAPHAFEELSFGAPKLAPSATTTPLPPSSHPPASGARAPLTPFLSAPTSPSCSIQTFLHRKGERFVGSEAPNCREPVADPKNVSTGACAPCSFVRRPSQALVCRGFPRGT
jgi:hypothetical protein